VLEQTGVYDLSEDLLACQNQHYNSIAALPEERLVRKLVCKSKSIQMNLEFGENGSRGRPKQQWTPSVYALLP